ncbi:MAG: hypothetical protein WKF78_08295 [Candidatus Limnocylindrales bacterium]
MRVRAAAEIEAEKGRAIAELRGEVADLALAAAGRVVGETMTDDRQRRLVQEFLVTTTATTAAVPQTDPDLATDGAPGLRRTTLRGGGLRGRHA